MPKPSPIEEKESPQSRPDEENIQMKIARVTDKSLDSTHRMRTLCEEAKEAGIQTLVALDDQGEKLDKIEQGLRDMNEDMLETEKTLQEINACCWGLCLPCTKKGSLRADSEMGEDRKKDKGGGPTEPTVSTINNGGIASKNTESGEEDEMEKSLDEVSKMVGNLRHMSIDIGSEINNQNFQLRRINSMAEDNSYVLARASERAKNIFNFK